MSVHGASCSSSRCDACEHDYAPVRGSRIHGDVAAAVLPSGREGQEGDAREPVASPGGGDRRDPPAYIEPGSPWQNPYIESFHSRVRDELLDVEEFSCLAEAQVVIGDWREDYNQRRPHSSLGMRSPAAFAATLAAAARPIALPA